MADEPPVRVRNGSVLAEIDPAAQGVEWTQAGPWKWLRRGPASDRLGTTWIVVNEKAIPGDRVRVSTTEGELFFTYVGGRTHLDTSVRFTRHPSSRRLLSSAQGLTITDVHVAAHALDDDGPDWVSPPGDSQP